MRHLCISYHTSPLEDPGVGLAGGMNIYLRGLLPALATQGIGTEVLAQGDRFEQTCLPCGTRVTHLPLSKTLPWDREQAQARLPEFVDQARAYLAGLTFDCLSAHYWLSGVAAQQLSPLPLHLMYHSLEVMKRNPADEKRVAVEQRLAQGARQIIFLTRYDRDATLRRLLVDESRACFIRPGADPLFFPRDRREARERLGLNPSATYFLWAARNDPGKNLAPLRNVIEKQRDTTLLVAGCRGADERNVRFCGRVAPADMPWWMAASDAVLCPFDYESFGLVTLEALASGRVAVVLPGGYWSQLFIRTRAGCVADWEGLGSILSTLTHSVRFRGSVESAASRLASGFSWSLAAQRWSKLFRQK